MFSTTDCWLLFSIGFSKKGANLKRIIADGDRKNHAIFTKEELETGMNNLINNDFIIQTGQRFYATEKAKQFYSKHKKILEGYIEEWIRFSDIMCNYPYIDSNDKLYALSEDEYILAISGYNSYFDNLLKKFKG
jgi:hypothetical protein